MTGFAKIVVMLSLGALLWMAAAAAAPLRVAYPQAQIPVDKGYFVKVLELAIAKSGGDYVLESWDLKLLKGRALYELEHGKHLDVVWAMTNRERENALLPVRIPLDRGLSGWRLALIRKDDVARFQSVQTLDDLRHLNAGQGYDWADTPVLRANGLPVTTGANADSLSMMLAARRFDYFPRSIRQIWQEAEQQHDKGLVIESSLALHYPAAVYFFVNKNNPALAAALENGLRRALADGSFDRLFRDYNGDLLQRANLGRRRIFELANPDLPEATPLRQKELWFDLRR
jgi:hypothetical protein